MLNSTTTKTTIVSCPGKVLISGGYLVLDRNYSGVVISTASRFYTIIKSSKQIKPKKYQQLHLIIRSPQFLQAEWSYKIILIDQFNLIIQQNKSSSSNKFVELAVGEALKLSLALQSLDEFMIDQTNQNQTNDFNQEERYKVTIDILGDNDFYSQPRQSEEAITPFNKLNTSLKDVNKTGLGSSAAMVTSLCSALLLHFTPSIDPKSKFTKILLHNLSQYVHSLAQGKVGSGFDVSAALWGTHVYRRFSPSCLNGLLNSNDDKNLTTPLQLRQTLDPRVNSAWTDPSTAPIIEPFSIPKYTTLLLADVDAGSHTPSMVSQVLKWKTDQSGIGNKIWNELSIKNDQLKSCFKKLEELSHLNEEEYLSSIHQLSNDSNFHSKIDDRPLSDTDDVTELFIKVSSLTKSIRKLMKNMGVQSNVPIEPDSQTKLLDECEKLDGIIGNGVPGAGGYDAIWVLVFTPPPPPAAAAATASPDHTEPKQEEKETRIMKNLMNFLNEWSHSSVRVLSPDSWVIGGRSKKIKNQTDQIMANGSIQLADHQKSDVDLINTDLDVEADGIHIFHDLNLVHRLQSISPDLIS